MNIYLCNMCYDAYKGEVYTGRALLDDPKAACALCRVPLKYCHDSHRVPPHAWEEWICGLAARTGFWVEKERDSGDL